MSAKIKDLIPIYISNGSPFFGIQIVAFAKPNVFSAPSPVVIHLFSPFFATQGLFICAFAHIFTINIYKFSHKVNPQTPTSTNLPKMAFFP